MIETKMVIGYKLKEGRLLVLTEKTREEEVTVDNETRDRRTEEEIRTDRNTVLVKRVQLSSLRHKFLLVQILLSY